MPQLLRTALRMRPDRLVLGEVRGAEAVQLVQAMNTGHDGSMSTVHANSAVDALARLCSLVLQEVPGWPLDAIHDQVRRSIDVVIHVGRSVARRASGRRGVRIRSRVRWPAAAPIGRPGNRDCPIATPTPMRSDMPTALLVAGLAALIVTPIAGRLLRPGARLPTSRARRWLVPRPRHVAPDYASVLDAIARQVRSGSSLAAAIVDEVDGSSPLGAIVGSADCWEVACGRLGCASCRAMPTLRSQCRPFRPPLILVARSLRRSTRPPRCYASAPLPAPNDGPTARRLASAPEY